MESIKPRITVLLRHFDENPALFLCLVAILIAIGFVIIVFVDLAFRKRKLRKEKEMYTGTRKYPFKTPRAET